MESGQAPSDLLQGSRSYAAFFGGQADPTDGQEQELTATAGSLYGDGSANQGTGGWTLNEDARDGAGSEDDDDDRFFDEGTYFSSRKTVGGACLDFIDEVSAGISNYLSFLEVRDRAIVYDRREQKETESWRELLQTVGLQKDEASEKANQEGVQNGLPCFPKSRGLQIGPCAPPKNIRFAEAGDHGGKPRLAFSACFECGNLALAKCENPNLYTLFMDSDVNTLGYTQWFYFAVKGGAQGQKVSFRLVNMSKSGSLFGPNGMRPVAWSEKAGRGWERTGSNIRYYPSADAKPIGRRKGDRYHTLAFTYTFEYDDDVVFFAYHYPYTFSYLQELLAGLAAHPYAGKLFQRGSLCATIAGRSCDLITIGEKDAERSETERKRVAVVTARVHPGESNASWMMHGFLQFILSEAPEAQALRESCVWYIIPMLNPDGVIQGNYRCGLAGTDLNRVYMTPHKKLHPTVWHLKELLKANARDVELFVDLHGHSKKEGIFFYGGKFPGEDSRNPQIQLLPRMCCLGNEDFKWSKCSFNVNESKLTTARLVAFLQLNICHVYTVEASFSGGGTKPEAKEEGDEEENAADPEEPEGSGSGEDDVQDLPPCRAQSGSGLARSSSMRGAAPSQTVASPTHARPAVRRLNTANEVTILRVTTEPGHGEELSPDSLPRSLSALPADDSEAIVGDSSFTPARPSPRPMALLYEATARLRGQAGLELQDNPYASEDDEQVDCLAKQNDVLGQNNDQGPSDDDAEAGGCPKEQTAAELKEFNPARLELVGPTIGRAIAAAWQLQVEKAKVKISDLLTGAEALEWTHLRYDRLTAATARSELAKLLAGRGRIKAQDDEVGSDSNPSGDEKAPEDLKKIHKRILARLKKRRTPKPVEAPPPEQAEEEKYTTVVAFGKAMKIPIKPRRASTSAIASTSALASSQSSAPPSGTTASTTPSTSARPAVSPAPESVKKRQSLMAPLDLTRKQDPGSPGVSPRASLSLSPQRSVSAMTMFQANPEAPKEDEACKDELPSPKTSERKEARERRTLVLTKKVTPEPVPEKKEPKEAPVPIVVKVTTASFPLDDALGSFPRPLNLGKTHPLPDEAEHHKRPANSPPAKAFEHFGNEDVRTFIEVKRVDEGTQPSRQGRLRKPPPLDSSVKQRAITPRTTVVGDTVQGFSLDLPPPVLVESNPKRRPASGLRAMPKPTQSQAQERGCLTARPSSRLQEKGPVVLSVQLEADRAEARSSGEREVSEPQDRATTAEKSAFRKLHARPTLVLVEEDPSNLSSINLNRQEDPRQAVSSPTSPGPTSFPPPRSIRGPSFSPHGSDLERHWQSPERRSSSSSEHSEDDDWVPAPIPPRPFKATPQPLQGSQAFAQTIFGREVDSRSRIRSLATPSSAALSLRHGHVVSQGATDAATVKTTVDVEGLQREGSDRPRSAQGIGGSYKPWPPTMEPLPSRPQTALASFAEICGAASEVRQPKRSGGGLSLPMALGRPAVKGLPAANVGSILEERLLPAPAANFGQGPKFLAGSKPANWPIPTGHHLGKRGGGPGGSPEAVLVRRPVTHSGARSTRS